MVFILALATQFPLKYSGQKSRNFKFNWVSTNDLLNPLTLRTAKACGDGRKNKIKCEIILNTGRHQQGAPFCSFKDRQC